MSSRRFNDFDQLCADGKFLAGIFAAILERQFNGGFQALDAFLLGFALAVRFSGQNATNHFLSR